MNILPSHKIELYKNFNLQRNNCTNPLSFMGVRENKEGKPFSYEPETRKIDTLQDKKPSKNTKATLFEIDEGANWLIKKANTISKSAQKMKKDIKGVLKKNKRVFTFIQDDNTLITGITNKKGNGIKNIKTCKTDETGNVITDEYSFNKLGQLESYNHNESEENYKLDLQSDEIKYEKTFKNSDEKIIAQINFNDDDTVSNALFEDGKDYISNKPLDLTKMFKRQTKDGGFLIYKHEGNRVRTNDIAYYA